MTNSKPDTNTTEEVQAFMQRDPDNDGATRLLLTNQEGGWLASDYVMEVRE